MFNEEDFSALVERTMFGAEATAQRHNYCPVCPETAMELAGCEYNCPKCGLTSSDVEVNREHSDSTNAIIRRDTGVNKGKYYAVTTGDYSKTQRRVIYEFLVGRGHAWKGNQFPQDVLGTVADQYNEIQQSAQESPDGETKKFVRRGDIKKEILACLLYFEFIKTRNPRKKAECAEFIGLDVKGFSRGENLLRSMHAEGKIKLTIEDVSPSGFADRYLEALGLDEVVTRELYRSFVVDLVEETERLRIGMDSQLSSKVAGAIWVLVTRLNLATIDEAALERAADGTKKNTFKKFYNSVMANAQSLRSVFKKHNVSLH